MFSQLDPQQNLIEKIEELRLLKQLHL